MRIVVKEPYINDFTIEGSISPITLDNLKRLFGDSLQVIEEDDEWVDIKETEWYKNMKERYTPAMNLAYYRKKEHLTQKQLGEMLGIQKQVVSDMEHERKSISKVMAKKIAKALDCPVALFI